MFQRSHAKSLCLLDETSCFRHVYEKEKAMMVEKFLFYEETDFKKLRKFSTNKTFISKRIDEVFKNAIYECIKTKNSTMRGQDIFSINVIVQSYMKVLVIVNVCYEVCISTINVIHRFICSKSVICSKTVALSS